MDYLRLSFNCVVSLILTWDKNCMIEYAIK